MPAAPIVAIARPDLVPGPMIFASGITSLLVLGTSGLSALVLPVQDLRLASP